MGLHCRDRRSTAVRSRSRSDNAPRCHSLRSRRFATPTVHVLHNVGQSTLYLKTSLRSGKIPDRPEAGPYSCISLGRRGDRRNNSRITMGPCPLVGENGDPHDCRGRRPRRPTFSITLDAHSLPENLLALRKNSGPSGGRSLLLHPSIRRTPPLPRGNIRTHFLINHT